MAVTCRAQIQACALRAARLDNNGVPLPGANNLLVSDAMVSMGITAELSEGEEFELKNACGVDLAPFKDCDRLKRLNVSLSIGRPDPPLCELLIGGTVLNDAGDVGYAFPRLNESICRNGVSIELWAKRITSGGVLDPAAPYAWWVFPRVDLQFNAATFENGPLTTEFEGFAVENTNWFNGPTNDWPMDSDRVAQWIPTQTLPTAACNYQTLAAS